MRYINSRFTYLLTYIIHVVWTAGDAVTDRGKTETDGSGLYEVTADDQQSHYSTSTSDDTVQSQLTLFIAANKPTSAGGPSTPATAAGNPIDKLYSMQTSYFTANWLHGRFAINSNEARIHSPSKRTAVTVIIAPVQEWTMKNTAIISHIYTL